MKWDIRKIKEWKFYEHPQGITIPEAGNAHYYPTGSWRSQRPEINWDKCTHCLFCFIYCPDSSIIVKGEKVVGIDLAHCKGCGVCAEECPKQAIEMLKERV